MEKDFWHEKWQRGEIAFHEGEANALLVAHFCRMNLTAGSRVFLPLCGKTRDIAWLLHGGFRVVGVELSELAVAELFDELNIEPRISSEGELIRYSADNIEILVGDIFQVSANTLGSVDAIYDRAALVALPATLRQQYVQHLATISVRARQLLISFEYQQSLMAGPPFSISKSELAELYAGNYIYTELERKAVAGKLKGQVEAAEIAWLLEPLNRV